jgi:FkbM family methyltransferase
MYFSQCEQDKFLEENVFKGYKNGVFFDVGAHDGISINNTLFFEKTHNWSGVNIEPIGEVYNKLVINRPNSLNIKVAICDTDGEKEFILAKGYSEMISGLKNNYDSRHIDRLNRELKQYGGSSQNIIVKTKKIETICDENNIKHINYLSIDVEGAEFDVIKSINFDKVFIDVIGFENNYEDTSIPIIKYLEQKNYKVIKYYTDIFMIHNESKFNQ